MPYKNPADKAAWKARNKDKCRGYRMKHQSKPELVAERESRLSRRAAMAELRRSSMDATLWRIDVAAAIKDVCKRIMLRDGVARCHTCERILPVCRFTPARMNGETVGQCKECVNADAKRRRKNNPDKGREAHRRAYGRNRSDPALLVRLRIRQRMAKAIKRSACGVVKSGSNLRYLGCTAAQASEYIAQQFRKRMSWDNYGSAWHIDHVVPLAAFNLAVEEQRKIAFHYTNLQPLWAVANMRKNDRVSARPHQPMLLMPRV